MKGINTIYNNIQYKSIASIRNNNITHILNLSQFIPELIHYYNEVLGMSACNNHFKNIDVVDRKKKLIELLSEVINFQIKTNQEV